MPPSQDIFTRVLLTRTIGVLLLSFRCSPFLLCFIINSNIPPKKIIHSKSILFLSLIIVCLLISIPHSGSRSGFGILVLTLACFIYVFLIRTKKSGRKFNWTTATPFIAFLSLLVSFSLYLNRDTTKEMLINTNSQITEASNRQLPMRVLLWTDLVNQIGHETLWGYGFNSYPAINPIHQSKEVRERRSIGLDNAHNPYTPLIGRGHSDFLEFISEFGIPFSCCSSFFRSSPLLALFTIPPLSLKSYSSAAWLSCCIF